MEFDETSLHWVYIPVSVVLFGFMAYLSQGKDDFWSQMFVIFFFVYLVLQVRQKRIIIQENNLIIRYPLRFVFREKRINLIEVNQIQIIEGSGNFAFGAIIFTFTNGSRSNLSFPGYPPDKFEKFISILRSKNIEVSVR